MKTLSITLAGRLRRRIQDLLNAGALAPGDRLPSSRAVAEEFDVDPRAVQAAYRILAGERLVDLRPRSGIFVRQPRIELDHAGASVRWLTEIFSTALSRDIPAPQLLDLLERALASRVITVATVASTVDQNEGMCRELREDYAVRAVCVSADAIQEGGSWPLELQDVDLLVTTETHAVGVSAIARQRGIPVIIVSVRRDIMSPAYRKLLVQPAFMVVADPRFIPIARRYFSSVPGGGNLTYLVAGRDALDVIPRLAPVYITAAARHVVGPVKIPGKVIPNARILAPESAREILAFVVRRQLESALELAQTPPSRTMRRTASRSRLQKSS